MIVDLGVRGSIPRGGTNKIKGFLVVCLLAILPIVRWWYAGGTLATRLADATITEGCALTITTRPLARQLSPQRPWSC
jgi:hypothetical protein